MSTVAQSWTAPVSVLGHSWPTFSLFLSVQSALFILRWAEFFVSSTIQNAKGVSTISKWSSYIGVGSKFELLKLSGLRPLAPLVSYSSFPLLNMMIRQKFDFLYLKLQNVDQVIIKTAPDEIVPQFLAALTHSLTEVMSIWVEHIPGFSEVARDDRETLINSAALELLSLRMAYRYARGLDR